MTDETPTYRSYGSSIIDDNLNLGINLKFLVRLCIVACLLGWYSMHLLDRLERVEENLLEVSSEVRSLANKQMVQEREERERLANQLKFYEKEMNLNVNPASWFSKKKRK